MLIYRHDMSSGLQEYVSIWTLFDSFSNLSTTIQLAETFSVAGKWVNTELIENPFFIMFIEINRQGIILAPVCLC